MIREFYRRPSEDDDSTLEFLTDVPPHAVDDARGTPTFTPEGVAVRAASSRVDSLTGTATTSPPSIPIGDTR